MNDKIIIDVIIASLCLVGLFILQSPPVKRWVEKGEKRGD